MVCSKKIGYQEPLLRKDHPIMNVFNRSFMILLSLIAIAFSIIVFLLVGGVVRPTQVSPGGLLLGLWSFFAQLNPTNATIAVIVCALVVIVAVIVFILELNILGREPAQFVVREESLGKVTVARSSVRRLVGYESMTIPGVVETRQTVDKGRDGLRVQVRAFTLTRGGCSGSGTDVAGEGTTINSGAYWLTSDRGAGGNST